MAPAHAHTRQAPVVELPAPSGAAHSDGGSGSVESRQQMRASNGSLGGGVQGELVRRPVSWRGENRAGELLRKKYFENRFTNFQSTHKGI
jgi:hypothetical protein